MFLAGAVALDEDALTCDFAQFYHVLDWRGLPCRLAAVLAFGLPDDSRIKMKMAGITGSPDRILMAAQLDVLNMLAWMQSKDGAKNRNRPDRVVTSFYYTEKKEKAPAIRGFESAAAFEDARAQILGEINGY